jgi:hypothetical protein
MQKSIRRKIATVSERASFRSRKGWEKRHAEMERRGKALAEQYPRQLQGRLVAVNELTGQVFEESFFSWDNDSEIRRKQRRICRKVFEN